MGKEQVTPKQWKKLMTDADNKTDLINFLVRDWSTNEPHIPVLQGKDMYMAIRDQAYCIFSNKRILSCSHVPELSISQEEAGTKMLLCAQFAASFGFQSVEIRAVDSDVAISSQVGSGTKVVFLYQEFMYYQDATQQV